MNQAQAPRRSGGHGTSGRVGRSGDLGSKRPPSRPPAAASRLQAETPGEASERREPREDDEGEGGEREGGPLGEAHELLGNALMLLVATHVAYLVVFKRPLARFMVFAPAKKDAR